MKNAKMSYCDIFTSVYKMGISAILNLLVSYHLCLFCFHLQLLDFDNNILDCLKPELF